MADPLPRFQVADQCYDGLEAATSAWIARAEPHTLLKDFGGGYGAETTVVMPVKVDWVYDDEDPRADVLYRFDGLETGSQSEARLPYYPVSCQLDAVQSSRIADLFELWPQLLLLIVVVWLARRMTDLFTRDTRDA